MDKYQQQIDDLQNQINLLKNSTTIPLDVGEAFKKRILPDGGLSGVPDATVPPTVTIDESGSSTVIAAAPFSGELRITINDITYRIPRI